MTDRLYRSRDDRMLAGVAAGVADYLDIDPSLIRIIWALLAILTGGIALVVYIVMAIVVPEAPGGPIAWSPSALGAAPTGVAPDGTAAAPDASAAAPDGSTVPPAPAATARRHRDPADRARRWAGHRRAADRLRWLVPHPPVRPGLRLRAVVADRRRRSSASLLVIVAITPSRHPG